MPNEDRLAQTLSPGVARSVRKLTVFHLVMPSVLPPPAAAKTACPSRGTSMSPWPDALRLPRWPVRRRASRDRGDSGDEGRMPIRRPGLGVAKQSFGLPDLRASRRERSHRGGGGPSHSRARALTGKPQARRAHSSASSNRPASTQRPQDSRRARMEVPNPIDSYAFSLGPQRELRHAPHTRVYVARNPVTIGEKMRRSNRGKSEATFE